MKKGLLIIGILAFSMSVMAQGDFVNKYFDLLQDDDAYTKVSVSSKMFSLFTELEAGSEAEEEFLKAISKLKGLKIVGSENAPNSFDIYKKALADLNKLKYEELMSVKDGDQNMKFSIKEKGGIIEELVMLAGSEKNFVLLSLYGEIDLKNISKIARTLKVDGLENLGKLSDSE
ncbi:MAG: DUF4252 domain-containing protein [Cyclobacteriaceae bacterium]